MTTKSMLVLAAVILALAAPADAARKSGTAKKYAAQKSGAQERTLCEHRIRGQRSWSGNAVRFHRQQAVRCF